MNYCPSPCSASQQPCRLGECEVTSEKRLNCKLFPQLVKQKGDYEVMSCFSWKLVLGILYPLKLKIIIVPEIVVASNRVPVEVVKQLSDHFSTVTYNS